MKTFSKVIRRAALALLGSAALAAQAGGPLSVCSGQPIKYAGAGTVSLNYDQGTLGTLSKATADALVTSSVSLWTNVTTSTVSLNRGADLPVDVTASNYTLYFGDNTNNRLNDGLNPVIYDTDGSIIDALIGVGAKSQVLGLAGSGYSISGGVCTYVEGRAVVSGFLFASGLSQTTMSVALAHEIGHLIGLDHSQLDTAQGLASNNTPLMYPIAQRNTVTLHDDDIAAVTSLYPDTNVNTVYGQISGNLRLADNATAVLGANVWAREVNTLKVYSVVSDYLQQGNGFWKLMLPVGTYTLQVEAIDSQFTGGSSVGPYSETYPTDPSFQAPLYVGGAPMAPVTFGNATPTQFVISAGCVATSTFNLAGAGTVTGNCSLKATPAITLGSSGNPSPSNQAVTFTAVLSGSVGTPTGTINFRDNGTTISGCGAVVLASGRATCTPTSLSVASHPITAVYSGDANYVTVTSSTLPQSITTPAPVLLTPSITVGSSANPADVSTSVTFMAVLSGSSGTPTGNVQFRDGSTTLTGCGSVALSAGRATCTASGLTAGSHPITAVYTGDATYFAITSSTLPQSMTSGSSTPLATPSITVGSSSNPSGSATAVTFVAVLSGSAGTPTGTVLFRDGSTTLTGCSAVVMSAGRANCTASGLSVGTHPITAVYSGDGSYATITSSTLPQSVTGTSQVAPSITVGSSANPATVGSAVTFTAVVSGSAGAPTGTFSFRDNGTTISGCGAAAISAGRATCTVSGLAAGTHPITAVYSGDGSYFSLTSSTLPQSMTAGSPTSPVNPSITVGSSANPSSVGNAVTFTAVISGSVGTPTGTVNFTENGTTISGCGSVALSAGRATCTVTGLALGTHPITAFYSGDTAYLALASSTLPQSVTSAPARATPSITAGSSANPATVGTTVTFVAVISGSAGAPTGTFDFRDNGTTISGCGAVAIVSGRANCAVSGLVAGMHPITATYSGDAGYVPLTSSTLPQTMSP